MLSRMIQTSSGLYLDIPASIPGTTLVDLAKGATIACSRSSVGVYQSGTYTWATAAINTPRIENNGLLIEASSNNQILYSDQLDGAGVSGAWSTGYGILDIANVASFLDGINTMDQIKYQPGYPTKTDVRQRYFNAATQWAGSAVLRTVSGTTYMTVSLHTDTGSKNWSSIIATTSDGRTVTVYGAGTNIVSAVILADTNPCRVTISGICDSGNDGAYLLGLSSSSSGVENSGVSYIAGGMQLECGAAYSGSYIATSASSVIRSADTISLPNNIRSGNYYIGVTATPENSRAWTQAAPTYLFSIGAQGTANSASLYEDGSGHLVWTVLSGTSVAETVTYTHGFSAGAQHRIVAGWSSGTPVLYVDGVSVGSVSGSGTGIASQPSTIYLGVGDATPTGPFGGYLKNIRSGSNVGLCL
jgi:Concanavalin A-like lectin/glucanases superfamily